MMVIQHAFLGKGLKESTYDLIQHAFLGKGLKESTYDSDTTHVLRRNQGSWFL